MPRISKKRQSKIARNKAQLRSELWPNLDENKLWSRKLSDGWLSVPRAMPIILRIMNMLAPKGKPVDQVYLDLWCRTYDDAFVIASKPREMAYFSGFTGERAETTWGSRIRILADLQFIDIKDGTHPMNYILLLNPYLAIKRHHLLGNFPPAAFHALQQRMIEIGAHDLDSTEDD